MLTVDQIMENISRYLRDVQSDAEDGFEALQSFATLPFQIWYSPNSVAGIELQSPGDLPQVSDLPNIEITPFDTSVLDQFNPDLYKNNVWNSTFFDFVMPIIQDQIENGGPGISQEVQDAMFNQTRERDLQILRDSLDATRSGFGKTGFRQPTDILRAQEQAVITRYEDTQSQRNREITALIAERAQQNMQVAINSGTAIERAKMDFASQFARMFMDMTNAIIARYKAEVEVRVSEFEAKMKVILGRLEVIKMNADVGGDHQDRLLRQWEINVNDSLNRTKAMIEQSHDQTSNRLTAAQSLSKFYAEMVNAVAGQLSSLAIKNETVSS